VDQINHTDLISGMNELSQIEMSVKAAQKMVGSATMQLDPEAIHHAENAIRDAKEIMNRSPKTGVDQEFLLKQQELLNQCEHQLSEANQ
jgi:glycine cleavage system protein P-like pyridoxal-binding family